MTVSRIRLLAALLPAVLLLHEGTYAVSGGAAPGAHGYLELAVPLAVAAAGALALASLLIPLLDARRRSSRAALTPFALAGGLIAVFAVQELSESLLFGGGLGAFAEAMASAWLLVPLALALGLVAAALIEALGRTEELLLAARGRRRRGRREQPVSTPLWAAPAGSAPSPLAFGLARRPPPAPPVPS